MDSKSKKMSNIDSIMYEVVLQNYEGEAIPPERQKHIITGNISTLRFIKQLDLSGSN